MDLNMGMGISDGSLQGKQREHQATYNVELHIDEIVLHGFVHRDRYAIQEAIQSELTRLIAENGVPLSSLRENDTARLDAGTVTMHKEMPPDVIGRQVAQAVYRGLGQNNGKPARSENNGRSVKQ